MAWASRQAALIGLALTLVASIGVNLVHTQPVSISSGQQLVDAVRSGLAVPGSTILLLVQNLSVANATWPADTSTAGFFSGAVSMAGGS